MPRGEVNFDDAFEGIHELNRNIDGVVHAVSSTYWGYFNYRDDLVERPGWALFCDPGEVSDRIMGEGGVRASPVTCIVCIVALCRLG